MPESSVSNPPPQVAGVGGFPGILAVPNSTPTTPVGATNVIASTPAGVYRINFYAVITTAGVGGTSFTINAIYTDVQGAKTTAVVTSSAIAAGTVVQGSIVVQVNAAGAIQYSITETGTFSTHPVLALFTALERLQ